MFSITTDIPNENVLTFGLRKPLLILTCELQTCAREYGLYIENLQTFWCKNQPSNISDARKLWNRPDPWTKAIYQHQFPSPHCNSHQKRPRSARSICEVLFYRQSYWQGYPHRPCIINNTPSSSSSYLQPPRPIRVDDTVYQCPPLSYSCCYTYPSNGLWEAWGGWFWANMMSCKMNPVVRLANSPVEFL